MLRNLTNPKSVFSLLAAGLLSGCMSAPMPNDVTSGAQSPVASRSVNMPSNLPPMRAFAETRITRPSRSNAEIAADFLDLSFSLESGRALPVLTRFEGPVTLSVNGQTTPALAQDVTRLLARLRVEAGIDIRQVPAGSPASITLQLIPKRELQRLVPHAACFVAPNVSGWEEYRKMRSTPATDWTRLTTRKRMSVFLPGDVSPQEMRDCLHEEVAQALGPVNDLYRLHNSVFNDDNFHTVLTGFDMLILRAYYAPELRSGMSRAEVARRLPALLARLNPAGGHATTPARTIATPRIWKDAIEGALGGSNSTSARRQAAARAVEIARQYGWNDTRLAFALFAQGRLNLGVNSDIALASFREAERIYQSSPNTRLQAAHMGVQLAAHALSLGNNATAIRIVDSHLGPVTQAQNAALLSTLLMIKAEALEHQGDTRAAQLTRLDSLGWARYGFGTQANVGARLAEIAALAPNG